MTPEIRFLLLYQQLAVTFSRSVAHLFLQHPYTYFLNFVSFTCFILGAFTLIVGPVAQSV
jgi:hypothetical protein